MFRKPTSKLLLIIANNLKSFRNSKDLSQEDFSELSGLHRTYIGGIERCEKNMSLSTLEVLAETLGITVSELLTSRDTNDDDYGS